MIDFIVKRTGSKEEYNPSKIIAAIEKVFSSIGTPQDVETMNYLLRLVEKKIEDTNADSVEAIQDIVEETLMEKGFFKAAKEYILYRTHRTELRKHRASLLELCKVDSLEKVFLDIQKNFDSEIYSLSRLEHKFRSFKKPNMDEAEVRAQITKAAAELTSQEEPQWEKIAARLLYDTFRKNLDKLENDYGLKSYYDKVLYMTEEKLYGDYILRGYSKEEIEKAHSFIDWSRNGLYTFSGLDLIIARYLIQTRSHTPLEDPQEMYLGIALHLALKEAPEIRLDWVKRFYDMLSKMQVTMATPTLANARKPYHQLSSCFIDTVPDSLDGIYRSIDNFAQVSKFGGGMGLYFGKVRALGGKIRGFEGVAGGIIRWIKLVNDTAVAVDQLGVRQGAAAVYLDAWHKDLPEFLQLRTNNGDDRMKAHDIFPAVCYPDLFWKRVKEDFDSNWYLLCPHDVYTTKGYHLEDYYGEEWEKRYLDCVADSRISKREIPLKDLVRLILKSAVETGTPFAFFRDAVNRANPNKHRGIIYCSNLCTEIAQNMSEIELVSKTVETSDGDNVVVTTTRPGDFVVCNLASLNLGAIETDNEDEINYITSTAVRALDNVIDLNFYPLEYARLTNQKYRSIGLGVSGYHHMLAKHKIKWESKEHLEYADKVFEAINFAAVKASCEIAKEKGHYSLFEGSDYQTGEYFTYRGYTSYKWQSLAEEVKKYGVRNAYMLAIAPTSSTSILVGTTAGLDPVMQRFFLEEKKGAILPRVAPDLSVETYWYYKNAHLIDQTWSVKASGVRQRHIDQAQSMNLYITNDFTMRGVLDLYILAWEKGVKTIYYVRSKSLEVEECESCSS